MGGQEGNRQKPQPQSLWSQQKAPAPAFVCATTGPLPGRKKTEEEEKNLFDSLSVILVVEPAESTKGGWGLRPESQDPSYLPSGRGRSSSPRSDPRLENEEDGPAPGAGGREGTDPASSRVSEICPSRWQPGPGHCLPHPPGMFWFGMLFGLTCFFR